MVHHPGDPLGSETPADVVLADQRWEEERQQSFAVAVYWCEMGGKG